ncbi:hypothetical protein O181_050215 [Austropuccinia psidii MF-1]|uniref:Uncharacterized protein n=1 Tax=Austropuccinia psidii MF-1 TaxID=1389203 RepID=A0A9Q3E0M4_9BASI|nr:hypothetical protein [Austropuccinia psidii MF-1]
MVLQVTDSRTRDVPRWPNVGGPIPVGGRPIYYTCEAPISRINNEAVVKRIRQIANSPPDPDAEGSDELDGEEAEVVHNSIGHHSSTSPYHPPAKRFQSHIIPSTTRNFQPTLATIPTSLPPASPSSSTTRPSLIPEVRQSPIPESRNSPIVPSQQPQLVASSSRTTEELSPLLFLPLKSFNKQSIGPCELPEGTQIWQVTIRILWPGCSEGLIEYANHRTIPGTASEEMVAKICMV